MAAVPLATVGALITNYLGAVAAAIIASTKDFLVPDESSRMDTKKPFKALFSALLIEALLRPASRVGSTSTIVCSAMLITRSSNLSVTSFSNFSTIL